jgi:RNA polymerase sigma factor (sigma-70 family)
MDREPTTRASLLVRLRDPHDSEAWTQFVDIYGPLVYRYARRHGLQDADAADLTQEMMKSVAGAIGGFRYDRDRGSFRGWLFTASRRTLGRFQAGRQRQALAGNPEFARLLENEESRESEDDRKVWDREFERRLFDWAVEQVRGEFQASTWDAFWRTAIDHAGSREVADALDISVGAVYVAKSRVLARLRAVIEGVRRE